MNAYSDFISSPANLELLVERCGSDLSLLVRSNDNPPSNLVASLFNNKFLAWLLYSSGNIPVDRKSKDRQVLFRGTFEALARGGAVALFPEGTSYTEPRIMQVKDGAAWAALEYTKWAADHGIEGPEVTIVPTAIVYTNKSKYRSDVSVEPYSLGRKVACSVANNSIK